MPCGNTISTSQAAPQLPYWHLKMDVRLLGTLAAIALVTTGLFSLAPAVYASRRATAMDSRKAVV